MANRITRNPVLRVLFTFLGLVCVGLAVIAPFVPFLPAFDMLLLAAFFFGMSNERLYNWLIHHKRFGPTINDYRAGLGITAGLKRWAVIAVALTFAATIFFATDRLAVQLVMAVLGASICWYIYSRPTKPEGVSAPIEHVSSVDAKTA